MTRATQNDTNTPTRIHCIGIGGSGMGPLAYLFHQMGYQVSGSDQTHNATTAFLAAQKIAITIGHDAKNILGAERIVHSNAILSTNVELQAARLAGIPTQPRGSALADVARPFRQIVVAGSHGKTSTTALITWALRTLRPPVSFALGGTFRGESIGAHLAPESTHLVIESDESDGSFLELSPTVAIVTNIDDEHAAHYGSLEHLQIAFETFLDRLPSDGCAVVSADCSQCRKILAKARMPYVTFGTAGDAHFRVDPATLPWNGGKDHASLWISKHGAPPVPISFAPRGDHEVRNVLAAVATLWHLGISPEELREVWNNFPGVGRRLEPLCEGAISVYSDYAHHPAELDATLRAVAHMKPDDTHIVIFQPHRYSRFLLHAPGFYDVLKNQSHVVILPVYPAGEPVPPDFPKRWETWLAQFPHRIPSPSLPDLTALCQNSPAPLTVVFCGAGDIHSLAQAMTKALQNTSGSPSFRWDMFGSSSLRSESPQAPIRK